MTTKNPYLDLVRTHYPDAITTVESVDRLFNLMQRNFGIAPHQMMLADSVCSDDVNSIEYPKRAYEMIGPFKMGGLDGFPFTGLTGMSAFSAHVPDDGAVFIYHAPHIGVSKDGSIGTILRIGQTKPSGCCGACRAALAKLQAGQIKKGEITELDYQQNTIEQIFLAHQSRILNANNPLMEATDVMQEAICERIQLLASKVKYNARYQILMGAIFINGDHDMGSFTSVRGITVKNLVTGETQDMLAEYMGV